MTTNKIKVFTNICGLKMGKETFDPLFSPYLTMFEETLTLACWLFGAALAALACELP